MNAFDYAMRKIMHSHIDNVMRDAPDAPLLKACLLDTFQVAFTSAFHLARNTTEAEIPTPETAIYQPNDAPKGQRLDPKLINANPRFLV